MLPKDLLVKLIVRIEKDVRKSMNINYKEIYEDLENNTYPQGMFIVISRCSSLNCREVEVWSNIGRKGKLNGCRWGCESSKEIPYCDAHDKLHYIQDNENGDFSVCSNCLPEVMKLGVTLAKKDMRKVDKDKVIKQIEEDELILQKEDKKISNYYAMSKSELLRKLMNIGTEIRLECEEEHQKELDLIQDISKRIESLIDKYKKRNF
jgi:hypothetical protein